MGTGGNKFVRRGPTLSAGRGGLSMTPPSSLNITDKVLLALKLTRVDRSIKLAKVRIAR